MSEPGTIFWRRKPIETLTADELRQALGEAVSGMVANSVSGSHQPQSFTLGLLTGIAAGGVASMLALALMWLS